MEIKIHKLQNEEAMKAWGGCTPEGWRCRRFSGNRI